MNEGAQSEGSETNVETQIQHQHISEGARSSKIDKKQSPKLAEEIEKQEDRVLKVESTVFQLANYNFVFQGVILTATIKGSSTSFKCDHFWFPFSLSLIGAVINFVTLLRIAQSYNHYLNQLDEKTETWYKAVYGEGGTGLNRLKENHTKQKRWRMFALGSSMLLFLAFSGFSAAATRIIPCH